MAYINSDQQICFFSSYPFFSSLQLGDAPTKFVEAAIRRPESFADIHPHADSRTKAVIDFHILFGVIGFRFRLPLRVYFLFFIFIFFRNLYPDISGG